MISSTGSRRYWHAPRISCMDGHQNPYGPGGAPMVPSIAPILQRLTGEWATLLTDPNPEVVAQLTKLLASAHKLLQAIERGQGVLHALIYERQGGKAVKDFASAA